MQLEIKLFVREHRSGFFTVRVVGREDLELYTTSLESARQDLSLLLGDLIERSHPSRQAGFLPIAVDREAHLTLEKAVPVAGRAAGADLVLSVLLAESRSFMSLWLPRPNLHLWLSKRDAADGRWEAAARALLARHLDGLTPSEKLGLRYERKEWVEALLIEAEPPPLSAFRGKNRNLTELPVRPAEEDEDEEVAPEDDDEDEEARPGKRKRKKRPETPTLKALGVSFTALAEAGELERAHGRHREVDGLLGLLAGPGEKAIAVIGPAGVGKTTILNELVHRLRAEETPKALRKRVVFFADGSRLVAQRNMFSDWQRQCLDVVAECEAADVIWYIGQLLPLLDAGKHIYSDHNVALLLRPYLASKRLTIVGECSEKDFARLELRDAAFARAFIPYRIAEPTKEEARDILEKVAKELAAAEGVEVERGGLDAILDLSRRYVSDGSHFGASMHFLRRTVEHMSAKADAKTAPKEARGDAKLGRREIVRAFTRETGLPERLVRDDLALDPREVEVAFRTRLVGQDEAVRRMVDLVAVIKAGLSDLGRPLGSFLFIGPTGVGKTETAKALATYLFGSERRLVRFDMSEYVGWDAVHRFLGSAETEGKLVEAVRRRPFSVVLLDEIEKASPSIFDVLLQVLGEARLTDEAGRTADFRNAVVVMTSNLGVESYKPRAGFDPGADLVDHFSREAERFFRPELFNRIDHVVPFLPLGAEAISEITVREIDKLRRREGLRQRRLALDVGPEVLRFVAERGVEPRYGARPLKRVLERQLAVPLARRLSSEPAGQRKEAAPALAVEVSEGTLTFVERERGEPASEARGSDDLRALIDAIDVARFRSGRWLASGDFSELSEELRLLDQLAQHKAFWDNRELADARMRGVDDKRALRDAWTKLDKELASLEDLAFEALWARDARELAGMRDELTRQKTELSRLERALFGRRFERPDAAVLYLLPGRNSEHFEHLLIEQYAALARAEGWSLAAHAAFRPDGLTPPPPPKPEPKARKKDSKDSKDDGKAKKEGARSKESEVERLPKEVKPKPAAVRERVLWRPRAELDRSPELEDEAAVRRFMNALGNPNDRDELALVFVGPHAASTLAFESGEHERVKGTDTTSVRVAFRPAGAALLHPADLGGPTTRVRTIQENKRIVLDHGLDRHAALEPRLFRIYRSFMRQHLLRAALGPSALAWARAFEEE